MNERNRVIALAVFLVVQLIWDIFLVGGCAYLVFWRAESGWWFVLAVALGLYSTKLFRQYIGEIPEEEETP